MNAVVKEIREWKIYSLWLSNASIIDLNNNEITTIFETLVSYLLPSLVGIGTAFKSNFINLGDLKNIDSNAQKSIHQY